MLASCFLRHRCPSRALCMQVTDSSVSAPGRSGRSGPAAVRHRWEVQARVLGVVIALKGGDENRACVMQNFRTLLLFGFCPRESLWPYVFALRHRWARCLVGVL